MFVEKFDQNLRETLDLKAMLDLCKLDTFPQRGFFGLLLCHFGDLKDTAVKKILLHFFDLKSQYS